MPPTVTTLPRRVGLLLTVIICLVCITSAWNRTELNVLWAYPTPINDFGFTFSIDESRIAVENALFEQDILINSHCIANMSVGVGCVNAISSALNVGLDGEPYDILVVGGQQFGSCVATISNETLYPEFSELKILHLAGPTATDRVTIAFPAFEQPRYIQGIICARAVGQNGIVGFVAAQPGNTILSRGLNAFILGALSTNLSVTVAVAVSANFLDVVAETESTLALIQYGAKCIAQHQNDLTVHTVASQHGIPSMGYATDSRFFAGGELVYSSVLLEWDYYLTTIFTDFANGTWTPKASLAGGYESKTTYLSGYSTLVNNSWLEGIPELINQFQDGSFEIFCEPALSAAIDPTFIHPGNLNVTSSGQTCMTEEAIFGMKGVSNLSVIVANFTTISPYQTVSVKFESSHAIGLMTISSIVILAAIASAFDVIVHRDHAVYRAASPLFCLMILFGIILAAISTFMWIGNPTKQTCMARWWLLGLGWACIFSCILAKNWRIWRIFSTGNLKVVAILNSDLLLRFVGAIVALDALILILWTAIDPSVPYAFTDPSLPAINLREVVCVSSSGQSSVGLIIFLAYNGLLLIPAALISYWTRRAKEEYNESQAIVVVVYGVIIIYLVTVGVGTALPNMYIVQFYMGGYGAWALTALTYAAIFLPKAWGIHRKASPSSSTNTDRLTTLRSDPAIRSVTSRTRPTDRDSGNTYIADRVSSVQDDAQ